MERFLLTDMPWEIPFEDAKNRLHIGEDDLEDFETVYRDTVQKLSPVIYYGRERVTANDGHNVTIGGQVFHSRILSVNLSEADEAYPYVMTSGRAAYEYACGLSDILMSYWAHEICEMALKRATANGFEMIQARLGGRALYSMNPGSLPDWPISQQRPLFDLLGSVREKCGVELTPSFLMLPVKSGSGIWFASETHYANCSLCPRNGCPHRRAVFEPELFREKYGD